MGFLPIPAAMLFKDFSFEVLEYTVLDGNITVGTYCGLYGSDENGRHISFLMSDQPQISVGNTLRTSDGLESFTIRKISYDRYNGKAELLKAYY